MELQELKTQLSDDIAIYSGKKKKLTEDVADLHREISNLKLTVLSSVKTEIITAKEEKDSILKTIKELLTRTTDLTNKELQLKQALAEKQGELTKLEESVKARLVLAKQELEDLIASKRKAYEEERTKLENEIQHNLSLSEETLENTKLKSEEMINSAITESERIIGLANFSSEERKKDADTYYTNMVAKATQKYSEELNKNINLLNELNISKETISDEIENLKTKQLHIVNSVSTLENLLMERQEMLHSLEDLIILNRNNLLEDTNNKDVIDCLTKLNNIYSKTNPSKSDSTHDDIPPSIPTNNNEDLLELESKQAEIKEMQECIDDLKQKVLEYINENRGLIASISDYQEETQSLKEEVYTLSNFKDLYELTLSELQVLKEKVVTLENVEPISLEETEEVVILNGNYGEIEEIEKVEKVEELDSLYETEELMVEPFVETVESLNGTEELFEPLATVEEYEISSFVEPVTLSEDNSNLALKEYEDKLDAISFELEETQELLQKSELAYSTLQQEHEIVVSKNKALKDECQLLKHHLESATIALKQLKQETAQPIQSTQTTQTTTVPKITKEFIENQDSTNYKPLYLEIKNAYVLAENEYYRLFNHDSILHSNNKKLFAQQLLLCLLLALSHTLKIENISIYAICLSASWLIYTLVMNKITTSNLNKLDIQTELSVFPENLLN